MFFRNMFLGSGGGIKITEGKNVLGYLYANNVFRVVIIILDILTVVKYSDTNEFLYPPSIILWIIFVC